MQLLVVAESYIFSINLSSMKSLEVLLAKGSTLRQLKAGNVTKLKIIDISDTHVSAVPIHYMPELWQLEIQRSMIVNLCLRGNQRF